MYVEWSYHHPYHISINPSSSLQVFPLCYAIAFVACFSRCKKIYSILSLFYLHKKSLHTVHLKWIYLRTHKTFFFRKKIMSNLISRSLPHIRICKCVWTPPFGFFQILILYAKNTNFATQKKFHPLRICDSHLSYSLLNLNQQNDDEEEWKKYSTLFLYGSFVSLHFFPSFLARIHAKNSSQSTHKATTNDSVHCLVRTTFDSLCVKCEQKKFVYNIFCALRLMPFSQ